MNSTGGYAIQRVHGGYCRALTAHNSKEGRRYYAHALAGCLGREGFPSGFDIGRDKHVRVSHGLWAQRLTSRSGFIVVLQLDDERNEQPVVILRGDGAKTIRHGL